MFIYIYIIYIYYKLLINNYDDQDDQDDQGGFVRSNKYLEKKGNYRMKNVFN